MEMTSRLNETQLDTLKAAARGKLPEIIEHFGLNVTPGTKRYHGPCPVHGGDKYNAFNIDCTEERGGNWKCYTRQCEKIFYGDIIGLVRALISRYKYGWNGIHDEEKMASFKEAINFLVQMTGSGHLYKIAPDLAGIEKKKFINNIAAIYNKREIVSRMNVSRDKVRSNLEVPSKYFISRGYTPEILDKYDVGDCNDYTKPMYRRAVAPIYNNDYTSCIGCTGRSIWPRCEECNTWHSPARPCPATRKEAKKFMKWKHNYGFMGEYYLYNYWFSKQYIAESGIAIIVESPGNIWRLEEAGFHNAVGTFGAHLTDFQKDILDKSGALALIVLSDPDEAGRLMNEFIVESCQNTYQLHFPRLGAVDIGDTSVELLQEKLTPIIDEVKKGL